MKCIKCGQEMVMSDTGLYYYCTNCDCVIDDLVYREPIINPNDYQIAIHCMICGKEVVRTKHIPVSTSELVKVCDDCKKAIAWAKENMKEKENETN